MFESSHSLGDVIKRARLEQGLTQINLAGRIAIDSRTILNIENYNGKDVYKRQASRRRLSRRCRYKNRPKAQHPADNRKKIRKIWRD